MSKIRLGEARPVMQKSTNNPKAKLSSRQIQTKSAQPKSKKELDKGDILHLHQSEEAAPSYATRPIPWWVFPESQVEAQAEDRGLLGGLFGGGGPGGPGPGGPGGPGGFPGPGGPGGFPGPGGPGGFPGPGGPGGFPGPGGPGGFPGPGGPGGFPGPGGPGGPGGFPGPGGPGGFPGPGGPGGFPGPGGPGGFPGPGGPGGFPGPGGPGGFPGPGGPGGFPGPGGPGGFPGPGGPGGFPGPGGPGGFPGPGGPGGFPGPGGPGGFPGPGGPGGFPGPYPPPYITVRIFGGAVFPRLNYTNYIRFYPGITIRQVLASTGFVYFGPRGFIRNVAGIPIFGNIEVRLRYNGRVIPQTFLNSPVAPRSTISLELYYSFGGAVPIPL